ncbi:MAG TPA: hypothetical protein VGK73_34610 [Polyangiaceae bacterium]
MIVAVARWFRSNKSLTICFSGALLAAACGEGDGAKSFIARPRMEPISGAGGEAGVVGDGTGGTRAGTGGSSAGSSSAGNSGTANASAGRAGSSNVDDGGEGGEGGAVGEAGAAGAESGGVGGSSAGTGGTTSAGRGGEGGEGGTEEPIVAALIGPRDLRVVEGMPYAFEVFATVPALGYVWERSSGAGFAAVPGARGPRLESATSVLADDNAEFRAHAETASGPLTSRVARLRVVPLGSAALVSLDSGAAHAEDHESTSWSTATYAGNADLRTGRLAASADTPDAMNGSAAYLSVIFYNDTDVAVTLPAGSITAHVQASYSANPDQGANNSLSYGTLSAYGHAVAAYTHQISTNHQNGVPIQIVHALSDRSSSGGTIAAATETETALDIVLTLPAFEIGARDDLWLTFDVRANTYFSTSSVDSATLSMVLPAGVELNSNATAPLDWVTQ